MSESQAVHLAMEALSLSSQAMIFSANYKDGVWEISSQRITMKNGKRVPLYATNSEVVAPDGSRVISLTNVTQVVARVRDIDGKVEVVKKP